MCLFIYIFTVNLEDGVGWGGNATGKYYRGADYLNVSVDDLIIMKISEPLEDLFGVEDDGCFIVFQRTPLGAQQRGQTSYKQDRCQDFI